MSLIISKNNNNNCHLVWAVGDNYISVLTTNGLFICDKVTAAVSNRFTQCEIQTKQQAFNIHQHCPAESVHTEDFLLSF